MEVDLDALALCDAVFIFNFSPAMVPGGVVGRGSRFMFANEGDQSSGVY